MGWPKWEKGRQVATAGISKLTLWSKWGCDVHLLRGIRGVVVAPHNDPVDGKEHHRCNITLSGEWLLELYEAGVDDRATVRHCTPGDHFCFRPDVERHGARFLEASTILSVGWVRRIKAANATPFWRTRLGWAMRNTLFTVGALPLLSVLLLNVCVVTCAGLLWAGLRWLSGSLKAADNFYMLNFALDSLYDVWMDWKRLIDHDE
jgi:hypothetical protein